jgi:hypothetical protein
VCEYGGDMYILYLYLEPASTPGGCKRATQDLTEVFPGMFDDLGTTITLELGPWQTLVGKTGARGGAGKQWDSGGLWGTREGARR